MLDSKADYLYTLPQWDRIFSPEKRKEIQRAWRESKTVINEVKIGRNDPAHVVAVKNIKNAVVNNIVIRPNDNFISLGFYVILIRY